MEKIGGLLLRLLFVTAVLWVCFADEKIWPDLSCHQHFENHVRTAALQEHRESWKRCQIRNNETGPCAKTCQLRAHGILYTRGVQKWVVLDGSDAGKYFVTELGVSGLNRTERKKENVSIPIADDLDLCDKKWGARYFKDRDIMAPCSVWADVIDCLENAYRCGSKDFKND